MKVDLFMEFPSPPHGDRGPETAPQVGNAIERTMILPTELAEE